MARTQRVVRAVVASAMLAVIIASGVYLSRTLGAKDTAPAVTPPVPVAQGACYWQEKGYVPAYSNGTPSDFQRPNNGSNLTDSCPRKVRV
jgi:hypothetical protein